MLGMVWRQGGEDGWWMYQTTELLNCRALREVKKNCLTKAQNQLTDETRIMFGHALIYWKKSNSMC